jgi:hypothetical protein
MIYSAYHLNAPLPGDYSHYVPVQVGAIDKPKLSGITMTDEIGTKHCISHKNRLYSELSMMKMLLQCNNDPIIGIAHYRRGFLPDGLEAFKQQFPNVQVDYEFGKLTKPKITYTNETFDYVFNAELSDWFDELREKRIDFILPKPYYKNDKFGMLTFAERGWMPIRTVIEFYAFAESYCNKEMYDSIKQYTFDSNEHYFNNMFICRNADYKKYVTWLIDFIEAFEQHLTNIQPLYTEQLITPRIFGYIAEYLFRPYLEYLQTKSDIRIKFVDVICFDNLKTDSRI